MTLSELLKRELAETKHYGVYTGWPSHRSDVSCKCGYNLAEIKHDSIHYENRHGKSVLYAADPHFFDKLKKLLTELHRREVRSRHVRNAKWRASKTWQEYYHQI